MNRPIGVASGVSQLLPTRRTDDAADGISEVGMPELVPSASSGAPKDVPAHSSPKLRRCASSAARCEACALVYLISMSGRVQPATAIRPDSLPPLASQR